MNEKRGQTQLRYTTFTDFPCRDCGERSPGCHGVCKRYRDAARIHEQERVAYQNAKQQSRTIDQELIRAARRKG